MVLWFLSLALGPGFGCWPSYIANKPVPRIESRINPLMLK